ncbi:bifunctional [glutamate--ammonia ligase]-adenylyl-L-tyrosine phosphorylase/[glutamate--ammonia-ligase] adenylyltransferase [Alteromonas sp. a30]|uniref:bifunctional [glutamate--ammonia ligase]-adenylyl-L-tyrosine phosphorylase/[glutamate--ammonia-ligase] adenylyltransferase n=1 Tax=Alteromonas sp. a30 TaxID=2730917 RepID=UPI002281E73E|nr:bifunctional [glutamate--ammonia ligase]-adenylyl-L-tyrosine phosphorylase/[glutamate--ammonia-ligase] adenylyltransferase [Alteromonas sp. a30]MCY7295571.1 bifunctional [glutamate--ammonia ligase]-adenylyl-L-tyrosine phosphorylase/[glutamate--ammonia-ligase] adenylyltransferase [Alteromonas sp. a30]
MSPLLKNLAQTHWEKLAAVADLSILTHTQTQQLTHVLALSDFVARQLISAPHTLPQLLEITPETCTFEHYYHSISKQLEECQDETSGHGVIRRFRHLHMMAIAWWDLTNMQEIDTSLLQVSHLADAIIKATYDWLYQMLCEKHGTPMGELGPQPMFIIAMGKLGGRELNYSSDIDLIFCYPQQGEITSGRKPMEHQTFFTRLGQRLITALNQTTVDGQAFRVDMRLRPFGESGPLVTHLAAIEDYYQEQGREWERYAMVKARVVNEDSPYAQELQDILRPFVFRRYIDFGVIDSLRNMKRLIQQEVRRRKLNNNIKLGRGGIREVEFIVQSYQLIRGGREPELQEKSLLRVLQQLVDKQIMLSDEAESLRYAYLYLRKVEHCLQQFNDEQTQDLPQDEIAQARLTFVMEQESFPRLLEEIDKQTTVISNAFQTIIGENDEEDDDPELEHLKDLWVLTVDKELEEEAAHDILANWLLQEQQVQCFQVLTQFKSELGKKPIGTRGAETLDKLMPKLLLETFKFSPKNASNLLSSLIQVMDQILQRTAYMELLLENHGALQQLVKLCDCSPWIANQLQRFPILLDDLLNPADLYNPTPPEQYPAMLRQVLLRVPQEDLELQMETLRQFKLSQQLRIAAADVTGALPITQVSDHLTALAETLVAETVNLAWHQMLERYGLPDNATQDNKGFAVIAYGKLGGIELAYGSDLDLVFLHDCTSQAQTSGPKTISAKQFYVKLSQRIIHMFTTKTLSGDLYEVDMRLRPSGNSGLLVSHIDSFENYQQTEAWTWEHQALMRSRCILGDAALRTRFVHVRDSILQRQRDLSTLRQDILSMREKMRTHLNKGNATQFDLKQDIGGITDIEFLVQYWVLAHAHAQPALTKWSDNLRILKQLNQLGIIEADEESVLIESYLDYRRRGHRLSLALQPALDDKDEFTSQRQHIAHIWNKYLGNDLTIAD